MSRIFTAFLLAAVLTAGPTVAQTNAPNHAGFPVTIAGGGVVRFGKPLVVDLDNNGGAKEIVVGTCVNTVTSNPDCDGGRRLYVFNSNGTVRSGWPQFLAAEPASGPAAGDLDGDGVLEIVIGRGSVVA